MPERGFSRCLRSAFFISVVHLAADFSIADENRAVLSLRPYITTLYQSVSTKRITHALYQNMGDSMAPPWGLEPQFSP